MRRLALLLALTLHAAAAQTPARPAAVDESPGNRLVLVSNSWALDGSTFYPEAEWRAGTVGEVVVRFVVSAEGVPTGVRVARGVSPGLDSAAVRAVRGVRFAPPTRDGEPVRVRATRAIRFGLDPNPDPPQPPVPEPPPPQPQPPREPFGSEALLVYLGQPWPSGLSAEADSGSVEHGAGRLVWAFENGTRYEAIVVGDTLRTLVVDADANPERSFALLMALIFFDVPAQPDDFYLAADLAAFGLTGQYDLRINGRRVEMRQPTCGEVPGYGRVCDFPTHPRDARSLTGLFSRDDADQSGRVVITFVVQADGRVTDARVVSQSGAVPEARRESALRDVRARRFTPATRGGRPVAAPSMTTVILD